MELGLKEVRNFGVLEAVKLRVEGCLHVQRESLEPLSERTQVRGGVSGEADGFLFASGEKEKGEGGLLLEIGDRPVENFGIWNFLFRGHPFQESRDLGSGRPSARRWRWGGRARR